MHVVPILFEDHSLAHFRPLAWSQPTFENRVGMFNLRERVRHLVAEQDPVGGLLARPLLAGLQQAAGWVDGVEAVSALTRDPDAVFLWINGRCGWGHERLRRMLEEAREGGKLILKDEQGLLAATTPADVAGKVLQSWRGWEKEADSLGCWASPAEPVPTWQPGPVLQDTAPTDDDDRGLAWIWEIVPATAGILEEDLAFLADGFTYRREPFGVVAAAEGAPAWALPGCLSCLERDPGAVQVKGGFLTLPERIWCGPGVQVAAGSTLDATQGPIILDRGVRIMPGCYLEGPLYIGPGSTVKAGATIYGESSFGILNKIAGEIGESTFGDFTNKQHDGFIGHAVLGAWVNLGAMTTCSDLKNNYGPVRVDLGLGQVDSGQRFVGLLMGDHAKTAIGTLFNTGTSVGFATNIFGGGMPPKFVGNFRWGGSADGPAYAVDRALGTAEVAMSRRGCTLTRHHVRLFEELAAR